MSICVLAIPRTNQVGFCFVVDVRLCPVDWLVTAATLPSGVTFAERFRIPSTTEGLILANGKAPRLLTPWALETKKNLLSYVERHTKLDIRTVDDVSDAIAAYSRRTPAMFSFLEDLHECRHRSPAQDEECSAIELFVYTPLHGCAERLVGQTLPAACRGAMPGAIASRGHFDL